MTKLIFSGVHPEDKDGDAVAQINTILADDSLDKNKKVMAINRIQGLPNAMKQKGMQAAMTGKAALEAALEVALVTTPAVTIEASMTEADFSGRYLQASGAIMLAAFLPKCQ